MSQAPASDRPLDVTAITLSAELGGPERVLLDFAERAFESDVRLTVVAPKAGPLLDALEVLGIPTRVVEAPRSLRRAIHRELRAGLRTHLVSRTGLLRWARALRREPAVRDADLIYSGSFKAHLAGALTGRRPRVWHLHSYGRRYGRQTPGSFFPPSPARDSVHPTGCRADPARPHRRMDGARTLARASPADLANPFKRVVWGGASPPTPSGPRRLVRARVCGVH